MDLHGIVSGAISAVNPFECVTLRSSVGYTVDEAGIQIPKYSIHHGSAQVQPMSSNEIRHAEQLNISGILKKAYLHGEINGIVRMENRGGDLITRADGSQWLVKTVLESWPDWSAVILQRQGV